MTLNKTFLRIWTSVFLVFCLLIGPLQLTAAELTAREVAQKSDDRDDGDTMISDMTMILIDRRNNKRVRKIKAYRKDYGKDTKQISFFLSPADVKNTAFLSYEWDDDDKDDDNWLYLPALRKVKRIASSNKKDSFMGSDFAYVDMNGFKISRWDYKFLKKSEMVDGADCWVIEAVPRKDIKKQVIKETGYVKRVAWIRKDNFIGVKGKSYVKKGKKIKYYKAVDLQLIDGIWTPKRMEMITTKRKRKEHATVLLFENIKYNQGVEDNLFNTQRMERGL